LWLFGGLLTLNACIATSGASSAAMPLIYAHAEHDLDCARDHIRIVDEYGGRYSAIGCGHKARYKAACEGVHCVVRDEDERDVGWRDRPTGDDR
jgi:hypothetical protein